MFRVWSGWAAVSVVAMAVALGGCGGSSAPPLTVSLTPSSPQTADQNQSPAPTIMATVTNLPKGAMPGVTWSLSGPGTLSNPTLQSVNYAPPGGAPITSSLQATITATTVADTTKSASVQFTVNPPPQISFQPLANGTVGVPYSQTIGLTGGTAPFQWSVYNGPIVSGSSVGGSVPDGLKLDPAAGTVSGTPTAAGTWFFETIAMDATGTLAFNGDTQIIIAPAGPAKNPIPFVNQPLVPTAISPGSADFTLQMTGSGFVSGAVVNFNRVALATTFVNAERLSATVPAASVASAGTAAVTVTNPGSGSVPSNVAYFQVAAPEATVSFAAATNSPLQITEPGGIAIGDFNADGKPDLAISTLVSATVLLSNGDGTFAVAPGSPMLLPSPPYDDFATPHVGVVTVGDFDNSGHLGFAVAEFNNEAAVILLGHGDGTFALSSANFANAPGMPIIDLTTADFNGDGNLDLAITSQVLGISAVDLGFGKGAFTTEGALFTGVGGSFPAATAVGDFNGDGIPDTVVVNSANGSVHDSSFSISLGNGDGTFTPASGSPVSIGQSLSAVVTGDFNSDGKLDLAMADSGGNAVIILLGNGDGTFGTPTTVSVGTFPDSIVAGDFNNDGKLDLAVANSGDNNVTLLLGTGDGTFTAASGSPHATGSTGAFMLAAADFNGDGKLDLAVLNENDVSILLQQ
jgi:hypothetical protein